MRILHLSTSDVSGGASRAAHRVHSGLLRLGCDSRMLVAKRYSGEPQVIEFKPKKDLISRIKHRLRRKKIEADFAPYEAKGLPARYELFSDDRTEDGGALVEQIPRDCDVVNLHWVAGFVDHEPFFRYFATERKDVPLVWRLADMAPLTGGCHYDQDCGRFTAQCGRCPEIGSSDENDLSREVWERKSRALEMLSPDRLHLVGTSRWIAGESRRSSLLSRFPVTIVPNGLDVELFKPRDKRFSRDLLGIPQGGAVVLFVAETATVRRKGFAELARAVEAISGIENLVLVSLGKGKPDLALAPGHRHVHLGRINDDRVLSMAYSAADVFVIPSLYESFGQTTIESMACGTPVVGFASGGIPDMVRPGVTGQLAPTGDTAALRDAIVRVLRAPDERAAMSENCRRIAVEEYAMEVTARQYVRLYELLLAGRKPGG